MKKVYDESIETVYTHTDNSKKQKGITLVALVVTIIILLILAGISIASLAGNGLFEKAKLAKEKQENAAKLENEVLAGYENEIAKTIDQSSRMAWTETVLWEGDTTQATTYNMNDDVSNYKYIYIQYTEMSKSNVKASEIIRVANITKNNINDQRFTSFSDRAILFHFIDNGFVVEVLQSSYPPHIRQIIGIK